MLNHAIGTVVTVGHVIVTTEDLRESAQMVRDKLMELCRIEASRERNVRPIRR
jgi:hypothetical protein